MKHNYHAIALDKKDIGEMDRLYTFYTRENGLMRIPARSIRKSEARLAAQVEDFVLSHITVVKNYGRGTLAGAVAEDFFEKLHIHYRALSCVDHVRKVFLAIVHEHDHDERVFVLLVEYLQKMEELSQGKNDMVNDAKLQWITHVFLIKLFGLQGYIFHVNKCSVCGTRFAPYARFFFDAHHGGVMCGSCTPKTIDSCAVGADTIKSLRVIYEHHLPVLSKIIVHKDVNLQLQNVVAHIEKWVIR